MTKASPPTDAASRQRFLEAASRCGGRIDRLLDAIESLDARTLAPLPGSGETGTRFRFLAEAGEADLTAARVLEPHLDAISILAEAGAAPPGTGRSWGVFAAEARGVSLEASDSHGAWTLTGTKPWCSLGGRLTNALVTANWGNGQRRLFRVDLRQPSITVEPVAWVARGLAAVASGPLVFDGARAEPVGEPGWYLHRPGFRWGAIGVAACWWGGCLPLYRALLQKAGPGDAGALARSRVGRVHRKLDSARLLLKDSARRIDARGGSGGADAEATIAADGGAAVLAHTVRGQVADAARETLEAVRDILGPAALAFDEPLARRSADLELYLTQYHRGPDDASLAGHLAETGRLRW